MLSKSANPASRTASRTVRKRCVMSVSLGSRDVVPPDSVDEMAAGDLCGRFVPEILVDGTTLGLCERSVLVQGRKRVGRSYLREYDVPELL